MGTFAVLATGGAVAWWEYLGQDDSLARVRQAGVLRVGYALEAPYALLDPLGQPTGESPEVARAVARHLGLRTAWILTSFDHLIPDLLADRFDLIAAGMFITPERSSLLRFSRPTLRVRPGWLTLSSRSLTLDYSAVQPSASFRIAVLQGSAEETLFRQRRVPEAGLLSVADARSGQTAVLLGQASALALSLPTVRAMALSSEGRLAARPAMGPGTPTEQVALALRRTDTALADAIDQALAGYLGSPAHLDLLARFGLGPEDLPTSP
ncbi:transporter substrate-binding domain-containing protein [Ideonella oryzae]|uniref:Transporter substrate-binding domain-containing protein n=1 Tax=Ideonella oryzae TaxID=2937441 RepID=A0ABT1BN27_9BURK|nr:transporter substrate-binding domain-containing protein [Ideonella oryzae]MCO5977329.1 transporter substrate-binding domain-containing protein [Ideonella oryzae]